MSEAARQLNEAFIHEMFDDPNAVLSRVRDLWWQPFLESKEANGAPAALNTLDACMEASRVEFLGMAVQYAIDQGFPPDTDQHRQRAAQFLKSNTGKMFERFSGLALAEALREADADYAVSPFRADTLSRCHGLTRQDLEVDIVLGEETLTTVVDADLFAFNPEDDDADVYLMSVKSTLKDRFHNVPFWNLLRRAAVTPGFLGVEARNQDVASRVRYVAICTDLAEEQPDFAREGGPRNLLRIDAALLDGAFVSASKAVGLPEDCEACVGPTRLHPFYRYSCFYGLLSGEP